LNPWEPAEEKDRMTSRETQKGESWTGSCSFTIGSQGHGCAAGNPCDFVEDLVASHDFFFFFFTACDCGEKGGGEKEDL